MGDDPMTKYERELMARAGVKSLGIVLPPGVEPPKKKNKYRAERTEYAGVMYDSAAEADRAMHLDALVRSGEVFWWVGQPKFRLGCPENVYVADFVVVGPEEVHVEDVKGLDLPKFRRDVRLWRRYGPCQLLVVRKGGVEVIEGGASCARG
jgi:hypothetical protein